MSSPTVDQPDLAATAPALRRRAIVAAIGVAFALVVIGVFVAVTRSNQASTEAAGSITGGLDPAAFHVVAHDIPDETTIAPVAPVAAVAPVSPAYVAGPVNTLPPPGAGAPRSDPREAVPELSTSAALGALVLVGGASLILFGRRRAAA